MAKNIDMSAVGLDQAKADFQDRALTRSGNAEHRFRLAALQFKGNTIEHREVFKTDRDIVKNNGFVNGVRAWGVRLHTDYLNEINSWVRTASTARMSTEDATTACVVGVRLKVELAEPILPQTPVVLRTHGKSLPVGVFLHPEQRREVARDLRDALTRWRRPGPLFE